MPAAHLPRFGFLKIENADHPPENRRWWLAMDTADCLLYVRGTTEIAVYAHLPRGPMTRKAAGIA